MSAGSGTAGNAARITLTSEMLRKLQLAELELLVEIDRICRKHEIRYTIDGGTLLGAVRHKGFIPWDDDADVAMLRCEYERFYEACKTELDTERFFLQEYRTDQGYPWGYSKLRRNGTVFLREGQEHLDCHRGIFVDIFLYDDVPDGQVARRLHLLACTFLRKCQYAAVGKYTGGNAAERMFYRLLDRVPKQWVFDAIRKIAERTDRHEGELARHMTHPYAKSRYGLPRHCFNEYRDMEFEGKSFRAMTDFDSYLTALYGDYRTLPPESERKTHPVTALRFAEE